MLYLRILGLLLAGAVLAEGAGYAWHRWACHAGIFRRLANDFLRRRHFDHHIHQYAPSRTRSESYLESCEVAFKVLGVVIVALLASLAAIGWLAVPTAATLLAGAVIYSALALSKLHGLYHLEDRSVRRLRLFRWRPAWRLFRWLRDFHQIHHEANANFSILIPLFDLIGGTYVAPSERRGRLTEDLFPGFDPGLSSSCGDPLVRRPDSTR